VIAFVVAGDPVPWRRSRSKGRQHFTDSKARQQAQLIAGAARIAGATPLPGPVKLTVIAYRRTRQRCDWDNLGKLVSDALNGVCWLDDSQVDDARVIKAIDPRQPRTEVEVEALSETVQLLRPAQRSRLVPAVRRYGSQ
jgi:Holliday junction resolvase RusA-like endonuclease